MRQWLAAKVNADLRLKHDGELPGFKLQYSHECLEFRRGPGGELCLPSHNSTHSLGGSTRQCMIGSKAVLWLDAAPISMACMFVLML